jgi:hypothetical protein
MERRTLDALSVFVFGLGLMLFLLVLGHTLRTYLLGFVDDSSRRRH